MPDVPLFTTFAECYPRRLQRVRIVGIYTKHVIGPADRVSWQGHARVQLLDDDGPLLDIYWGKRGVRDPAEVAAFEGKYVVVEGTFHRETPQKNSEPAHAAHYTWPYISVESIRLAEPDEIPTPPADPARR